MLVKLVDSFQLQILVLFFNTGETLAVRQSAGTSPVSKDVVSVRREARSHQLVL